MLMILLFLLSYEVNNFKRKIKIRQKYLDETHKFQNKISLKIYLELNLNINNNTLNACKL